MSDEMDHEQAFFREWDPPEGEDDFFLKVRIEGRWDEAHFRRMIAAADALLDQLEAQRSVPAERLDFTFQQSLGILVSLLRHPGFLAENELGMTADAYARYIEERVELLHALRARYASLRERLG